MSRAEYHRQYYHVRKARGRCLGCSVPLEPDAGTRCATCAARNRERQRAAYRRRRLGGLCACGSPAKPGRARCAPCTTREADAKRERRRNGTVRRASERREAETERSANRWLAAKW